MPIQPRFLSFKEDFTRIVVSEEAKDGSVLIFPTDAAKQEALRIHRLSWKFEEVLFLNMDEMKSCLFMPKVPVIREEKRTLLLYQALDDSLKSTFYIQNYFQSIDLANKFFQFFEELNEEMIDPEKLLLILEEQEADLQDWQIDTYTNLLQLRKNYSAVLNSKGFTDTIFANRTANLQLQLLDKYERFVFVNQFYYTKLESHISTFLEDNHKEVVVYYHMPESILEVKDWQLDSIADYRIGKIRLVKCFNHFGMLSAFFQMMETKSSEQPELILDPVFTREPYAKYLSASKFAIPINDSFCRTTVFRFWEISDRMLQSLLLEPGFQKYLLPLISLGEFIFTDDALSCFVPQAVEREIIRSEFDNLVKNDYQYIDLDLQFLDVAKQIELNQVTIQFLNRICTYLKQLLSIWSIKDFINLVNRDNGLPVQLILSDIEKNSSNLEEVLYEALGNLQAIEELKIVTNWSSFFTASPTALAQGIVHLVLEFLKPKMIRYNHSSFEQKRTKISNLIDTRNLCYQHIAVLNANEGDLPGTTQVPWLFSETQRQMLGLKTYEDIRLREKYYFFRFLLSAETAWIYYLANEDEDKDASSFVEEIKLFLPSSIIETQDWNDNGYKLAYSTLFEKDTVPSADIPNPEVRDEFFHLPFDPQEDLEANYYLLDYSHYAALRVNSFASYLQYHTRLEEIEDPDENCLTEKMIGNISHDFYRHCWSYLNQHTNGEFFDIKLLEKIWTPDFLEARLSLIMNKVNDLYYKLPHNYSDLFFREILWQQLIESTDTLVKSISEIYGFQMIRPIPEQVKMTDEERKYKVLFEPGEKDHGIGVKIRGRADLRLEDANKRAIIIDYKTTQNDTNLDRDQLLFYILFYYDWMDSDEFNLVKALFYMIFMQKVEDLDNKKSRDKLYERFTERLDETLEDLQNRGFALTSKSKGRDRFADITRVDLQRMLKGRLNVTE